MCVEVAHVLHFGLESLMEMPVDELIGWHEEAEELWNRIHKPAP